MRRFLAACLFVTAGCVPAPPSPSAPPPPSPSAEAATSPGPSVVAALDPCRNDQISVTPGHSGAAAGTNYLTVFVELAQGPACTLPWGPMITIRDADGTTVARATDTEAQPVQLDYITRYYIAWSAECGSAPTGLLAAHIEFSSALVVDVPIGDFRPSCVDRIGQSVSMYADERDLAEPVP